LLEEVAASGDPIYAVKAKNWLSDIRSGKLTLGHDRNGMLNIVEHGEPASLPSKAQQNASLSAWEARMAIFRQITNVAPHAATFTKLPASWSADASFSQITAARLWRNKLFIADGATLQCFDTETRMLTDVRLPSQWKHSIAAIEADENGLWLGTGDGLFRITATSGSVHEYGSKEGLPMGGVSALRLSGGKLFMGVGSRKESMIGWLDLATDKFTGVMQPFLEAQAIVTLDAKTLLVGSPAMLQQFDVASKTLTKAMPDGFKDRALTHWMNDAAVAINSKYLVILMPSRCVGVYSLDTKLWTSVNISTNEMDNEGKSLAFDPANPDWLWIGGMDGGNTPKLTLLNIASSQILAEGHISGHGETQRIFSTPNTVVFAVLRFGNGLDLCSLEKTKLFGTETSAPLVKSSVVSQPGDASPPIETKNVAARSDHPLPMNNPSVIAYLNDGGITAYGTGKVFGKGALIVACGTTLKTFDWTGVFGFGSGTDFEKVNLPLKIEHPITAIANDRGTNLWLGTDGGGLIRIPQSGAAPTIFGEKDGFPMSSITSLRLTPAGKLVIGFGHGRTGALGCLDTATLKFTELMSPATVSKNWEDSLRPPPISPIGQIKTEDETNTFWIGSELALYRLKLDSRQWSQLLPSHDMPNYRSSVGLRTLSIVSGGFAVTTVASGGIAFCKLSDDKWTHLDLSTNLEANITTTLAFDEYHPNNLWIGSRGKISILDMNTKTIIGECSVPGCGEIELMVIFSGDAFFIGDNARLYHWENPSYKSNP